MNTTYNHSTIVFALALVPLALKYGGKKVYVFSLFLTGIAMLSIPYINDPILVILPMILFGIGGCCTTHKNILKQSFLIFK